MLANKASAAATAAKASFEKLCQACQKTYYSENAYNNHLNSQKHKSNVAKAGRAHLDDSASVTGSVMSSAFSLGESMSEAGTPGIDRETEKHFSEVVDGMKNTSLDGQEPGARRSRPQQPEGKPGHPLSPTNTNGSVHEEDRRSVASSNKPQSDPLMDCLFCNYRSPNFSLSIRHMERFHGMFIPEKEFLVEPEELVKYLHRKIHEDHQCLKCHKTVHSASGIQTHMRDRGHCMIGYDSDAELVEIGQFYDFRSSYPDAANFEAMEHEAEDDSDDSTSTAGGGVKLGAPRKVVTSTDDGGDAVMSGDEDDEGWETDSTVSSVPTDEITAVPIDRSHRHKFLNKSRHHAHGDPRPHRNADGFHSHAHATPVAVYHDDYELHLPSGRTAGHRSLNKYYRQNLRNYPGVAERMESRRMITAATSDSDGDVNMEDAGRGRQLISRANGGMGMIGVSDTKKAEIRAVEKREQKREQRARTKYQAGNERRANFQKHFRDPLLQ